MEVDCGCGNRVGVEVECGRRGTVWVWWRYSGGLWDVQFLHQGRDTGSVGVGDNSVSKILMKQYQERERKKETSRHTNKQMVIRSERAKWKDSLKICDRIRMGRHF